MTEQATTPKVSSNDQSKQSKDIYQKSPIKTSLVSRKRMAQLGLADPEALYNRPVESVPILTPPKAQQTAPMTELKVDRNKLIEEHQEYLHKQAAMLTEYMIKKKMPAFSNHLRKELDKQMALVVKRLAKKMAAEAQ